MSNQDITASPFELAKTIVQFGEPAKLIDFIEGNELTPNERKEIESLIQVTASKKGWNSEFGLIARTAISKIKSVKKISKRTKPLYNPLAGEEGEGGYDLQATSYMKSSNRLFLFFSLLILSVLMLTLAVNSGYGSVIIQLSFFFLFLIILVGIIKGSKKETLNN